jgi:hypothetical protein
MTTDERVRQALDAIADEAEASAGLWARIERQQHRHPDRRRRVVVVLGVAAMVAAVAATVGLTKGSSTQPRHVITRPGSTVNANGWTAIAPSPLAGRLAPASATDGHRLFIWGGADPAHGHQFNDGALYDPASDTWESVPAAPAPLAGQGEAVWDGKEFLVLAPADADHDVALASYDPAARTWKRRADAPFGARSAFDANWTVEGGELVVTGGGELGRTPLSSGASYDPTSDRWSELQPAPYPHFKAGPTVFDGTGIVVIGGFSSASGAAADAIPVPGARYALGGDWTPLPDGPIAPTAAMRTKQGVVAISTPLGDQTGIVTSRLLQGEAWTPLPDVDAHAPVLRVVGDGRGGWIALTGSGGVAVPDPAAPHPLPSADLSERQTAVVAVIDGELIVWGGQHVTGNNVTGLTDGLATRVADPLPPEHAGIPASVDIGPALDPDHLGALPNKGFVVAFGGTHVVVLVDLDGHVRGHLTGFDTTPSQWSNSPYVGGGPLTLSRDGRSMVLGGPSGDRALVPIGGAIGAVPLANGAVLEPFTRATESVVRFTDGTSITLTGLPVVSHDRVWVTARVVGAGSTGYASAVAHNVVTGDTIAFDRDCYVTDDTASGLLEVCGDTIQLASGSTTTVVRQAGPANHRGVWIDAQLSPDTTTVLADFQGECEAVSAWYVPVAGNDHDPRIVGPPAAEWDSGGIGWTADNRILAKFGPGVCGTALPQGPGIYLVTPGGAMQQVFSVPADDVGWGADTWTNTP